jgi:hypothetical protein
MAWMWLGPNYQTQLDLTKHNIRENVSKYKPDKKNPVRKRALFSFQLFITSKMALTDILRLQAFLVCRECDSPLMGSMA